MTPAEIERHDFARRLNEVLDDASYPAKHDGRQLQLGRDWDVTDKGARKWIEGESIPEIRRLILMAKRYHVSLEWLATGRGKKSLSSISDVSAAAMIPPPASPAGWDGLEASQRRLVEAYIAGLLAR